MGTGCYIYKVYNYHNIRTCGYKRSGMLSRLVGLVVEWFVWLSCVELCDLLNPLVDHVVCILFNTT
jgi:hypothetical protein